MEVTERSSVRSTNRWGATSHEHESVHEFERCKSLEDGLHTILGGRAPIDVLLRLRPGRPLIFSFHGNTPRSPDLKLPVFTGLNVTRDLDASFVALSDPSLYLDPELKLGWFAGSAGWQLQALLKRILRTIIAVAQSRDVIFFGGSGGGFAALYYSAAFPGSLALVWNPQTDIAAYNPLHVIEYGRIAFGLTDHGQTKTMLPGLIECNLARVYDRPRGNLVLYLQNRTDGHVIAHMRPFLASLGADVSSIEKGVDLNSEVVPGVRVCMADWGDGHIPPSPGILTQLLEAGVSAAGRWPEMLRSEQFADLLSSVFGPGRPASSQHERLV